MKTSFDYPIPQDRSERKTYPFSKMDVGESVFIEGVKIGGKEYTAAAVTGNRKGWRFVGRKVEGGIRVWRVE